MIILDEINSGHGLGEAYIKSLQNALKRYCYALTKSPYDAEDLAQDTWVKALDYMKKVNKTVDKNDKNHVNCASNTNLSDDTDNAENTENTENIENTDNTNHEALLLRIARNTWIDIVRRKATFSRLLKLDQQRVDEAQVNGSFEIEAAFQVILEHLSSLQLAVFLLRDVFEYTGVQAAEMLDTTEGAVKSALYRARKALDTVRKELLAEGPPLTQDTDLQTYLRSFTIAYERGEIAELIELIRENETQEPIMAVSSQYFHTVQYGGFNSNSWNYDESRMRMTA